MSSIKTFLTTAFCMVAVSLVHYPLSAAEMSVENAYKRLGHQQTPFKKSQARMTNAEKNYLDHLFFVTDLAFSERMTMLNYFNQGKDAAYIDKYNEEIKNLLASFELVKAPNRNLEQIEDIIIDAIKDQKNFFNVWHEYAGTPTYGNLQKNYAQNPYVQSSHKKLIKAYMLLKQAYPNEGQHNQKAFYDHLCALDFI